MRSFPARAGAVLAAALLGGGAAFALAASVWDGGTTTTVVRELDAGAAAPIAEFRSTGTGKSVGEIYREAASGVVQVTSNVVTADPFFGEQRARGLGSGFVIDKAGHVITNFHVVEGADEVFVNFSGEDQLKAKVVGADPSTDIAVLEIDAQARALTPLPLGNSDTVRVGDAVVAIGNPFGLDRTVTSGIVSALQREIEAPNGFPIEKAIQTDASINKGNSGGPLLNANGQVIGVNSQIATGGTSEGNVGIGFAVPINTVREVASQLIENGTVEHAYLGVTMQTIDETVASTFRLPADRGVLVVRVYPDSPAEQAGLRGGERSVVLEGMTYAVGGDVITRADGRAIESADELREIVASKQPGDTLTLEVAREGGPETIRVELGRRPDNAPG